MFDILGLATQTILTIPVNHVNSSDQMVNLALNNGQVMQTSLANLQAMAHSNLMNGPAPPGKQLFIISSYCSTYSYIIQKHKLYCFQYLQHRMVP